MFADQWPLLMVAGLAFLALLLGFWQLRISRRLQREIDALKQALPAPAIEKAPAPRDFSSSLHAVERQQLQAAQVTPPPKSVDKYSYISSLAEQGLSAKGIAEALQMPLAEVEQLLRLVKLKHGSAAK